ncbi:MAG: FAD-dependent monooxygenase [Fulvimarina manganoxydans]|uniref:FAD-dependent monooxygenase n=1 Tax=Fulvimarina manganoxydans TaxID=937218 RepID=UPI002357687D|nr:FAD-dependent monooxygenase [Fulvimarina manganoxydans]MCK5930693.1 FAD-dependent monooxygenase [Fulvimarina manganoxydans]
MQFDRPILIVGAGIAGLTTALSLAKRGIASRIVERARALEEVGAGLQLSPNALRVMRDLGLLTSLETAGVKARSVFLKDARSSRTLARVPVEASDGTPYLSIHRADLQRVLYEAAQREAAIQLDLGCELTSLQPIDTGLLLAMRTTHSETKSIETDLLIAADGVRSQVAANASLAPAKPSGMIAWRGRIEMGNASSEIATATSSITAFLDRDRHAVAYPIAAGRQINLVLIEGDRAQPGETSALASRFSPSGSDLSRLIHASGSFTPWPLSVTPEDRPWRLFDDRALLVGDAAHGMLPFAAQGAAMAIEDAAVLAHALAMQPDRASALAAYETARRPRVDRVRRRAGFHRFVYHLPRPFSFGRDLVMALSPADRLRASLAWLYDWTPPA